MKIGMRPILGTIILGSAVFLGRQAVAQTQNVKSPSVVKNTDEIKKEEISISVNSSDRWNKNFFNHSSEHIQHIHVHCKMNKICMKKCMCDKAIPFFIASDDTWIEKQFWKHFPVSESRNRNEACGRDYNIRQHKIIWLQLKILSFCSLPCLLHCH